MVGRACREKGWSVEHPEDDLQEKGWSVEHTKDELQEKGWFEEYPQDNLQGRGDPEDTSFFGRLLNTFKSFRDRYSLRVRKTRKRV